MTQSLALDWRTLRRTKVELLSCLRRHGLLWQLPRAMEVDTPVELCSTSLFSPAARFALMPKLSCGVESLVGAYEIFADQVLGAELRPGRAPERALSADGSCNIKCFLNLSINALDWFQPAVRLVALAQQFPEMQVHADFENNRFEAVGRIATMRVSPDGVYVNYLAKVNQPAVPPRDVAGSAMWMPPVVTDSSVLSGLHRLLHGTPEQELVRILYECMQTKLTTGLSLYQFFTYKARTTTPRRASEHKATRRAQAQARDVAVQILEQRSDDMMRQLYTTLVPLVFTASEFKARLGSASQRGRNPKEQTVRHWMDLINAVVGDAQDN